MLPNTTGQYLNVYYNHYVLEVGIILSTFCLGLTLKQIICEAKVLYEPRYIPHRIKYQYPACHLLKFETSMLNLYTKPQEYIRRWHLNGVVGLGTWIIITNLLDSLSWHISYDSCKKAKGTFLRKLTYLELSLRSLLTNLAGYFDCYFTLMWVKRLAISESLLNKISMTYFVSVGIGKLREDCQV